MEKLEKVEQVRAKCDVSYEEAREALEACDYDVLDAIVYIERKRAADDVTSTYEEPVVEAEVDEEAMSSKFEDVWKSFCARAKSLVRGGMKTNFVLERNGERVAVIPVLILLAGLFLWGATLWLLVIGLFFGFRYHIEGVEPFTVDVNGVMDKAADAAEDIKQNFA